jgi:small-conductance mechanosensitive channel
MQLDNNTKKSNMPDENTAAAIVPAPLEEVASIVPAPIEAAAEKTEHIVAHPEPFVLQTSLDDNYVSYEINGWTRKPEELARTYSDLHANILDEFHGQQVEITSPAFRANRDANASTIPEVIPREEPPPQSDTPA